MHCSVFLVLVAYEATQSRPARWWDAPGGRLLKLFSINASPDGSGASPCSRIRTPPYQCGFCRVRACRKDSLRAAGFTALDGWPHSECDRGYSRSWAIGSGIPKVKERATLRSAAIEASRFAGVHRGHTGRLGLERGWLKPPRPGVVPGAERSQCPPLQFLDRRGFDAWGPMVEYQSGS
jgi:hypothetical protein